MLPTIMYLCGGIFKVSEDIKDTDCKLMLHKGTESQGRSAVTLVDELKDTGALS